jgi:hypothetical protein
MIQEQARIFTIFLRFGKRLALWQGLKSASLLRHEMLADVGFESI